MNMVAIVALLTRCEDPMHIEALPPSPYEELEKEIRLKYDSRALFTWNQYSDLLLMLSKGKFLVLPLNEMRNTFDNSRVVVGFRHDIDWNPFKALEMAGIEKDFGIRATYFILPTSDYYGHMDKSGFVRNSPMDSLCRELYDTGAEIGIHNDLLTVMIEYKLDPYLFNQNDLSFFRSINVPIYGTASHGSPIAKVTVPSYQMFSDFAKSDSVEFRDVYYPLGKYSLKEYGFEYEAYFINYSLYFSESGGKWNDPGGFTEILSKLENSIPGDRIQILTHPEWWGRKN